MRRFFIPVVIALTAVVLPWDAQSALADSLGQSAEFRVNSSFDARGHDSITATLRALGAHAYLYVDDRYWDTLSSNEQERFTAELSAIAQDYDRVIYPTSIALWGTEANPGVDGDGHTVIVLQRLVSGSGGYFETIHNYTKERAPNGNAREMIFVNVEGVFAGTARSFITHELQHLISFNQRELTSGSQDDVWLNEGRSEFNVTAAGYSLPFERSTLQRRMQSFLRTPSDSLTEWPNTSTDYSITSLFTHYLADRYGTGVLSSTVRTAAAGTAAIDAWLSTQGAERFGDIFTDWMVATHLNDASINSVYAYKREGLTGLHVNPTDGGRLDSSDSDRAFSATIKEWQPIWVSVSVRAGDNPDSAVNVRVRMSDGAVPGGAVIARYGNGEERVHEFGGMSSPVTVSVPTVLDGSELTKVIAAVAHGQTEAVQDRDVRSSDVEVRMALGDIEGDEFEQAPQTGAPSSGTPVNGDLIRRRGQEDVYVVWGGYRRYLSRGILALYGFQNRPVLEVSDDVFFGYNASIYIRTDGGKQVFAVWPDGTKHWMNFSAAQWDASGRDWGAIFTVNEAESAYYISGADIAQ